jgi:hypothetical protein
VCVCERERERERERQRESVPERPHAASRCAYVAFDELDKVDAPDLKDHGPPEQTDAPLVHLQGERQRQRLR